MTLSNDLTSMQVSFSTPTFPTTPAVSFYPSSSPNQIIHLLANHSDIHTFIHPPTLVDCIFDKNITKLDKFFELLQDITTITMKPLERGTQYSYYVSGMLNNSHTQSPTYSFFTMPHDDETLNILFILFLFFIFYIIILLLDI